MVEESVPVRTPELVEIRDTLSSKIGFKNLLEFLYKFGYEESNSNNSCSFESCTSSNIDRKALSPNESTIFAELFLKLMYKNWEGKLEKMNYYIEESNASNPKKAIKIFNKTDFIIGHALIIGATCYCQSGLVLFAYGKEQEEAWDTII